ncbi:hypothetical protein [Kitasatospora mediocidica]|uniref:hypothetical protein n=1 Tax=Kitasatospora mediocidica TaxID=58352 RepID=UPI000565478E|nr:hypothetical protein [Kitasatospora mediocidica]
MTGLRRVLRVLVAVVGLALALNAPWPAGAPQLGGLRIVSVVTCFALAACLHLLRPPEAGLPDALRLREWHRRAGRWAGACLAVTGVLAFAWAAQLAHPPDRLAVPGHTVVDRAGGLTRRA